MNSTGNDNGVSYHNYWFLEPDIIKSGTTNNAKKLNFTF